MSLNITVKQGKKIVHTNNFYGCIHFNKNNRHVLVEEQKPEDVVDFDTYKEFVEKTVEKDRQQQYLNLVNKDKPVKVIIY